MHGLFAMCTFSHKPASPLFPKNTRGQWLATGLGTVTSVNGGRRNTNASKIQLNCAVPRKIVLFKFDTDKDTGSDNEDSRKLTA